MWWRQRMICITILLKKHFNIVFFLTISVFHHSILESQKQWYETHMNSIFSRNYSVKKSQFRWNYWSIYFFRENNQIDEINYRQNYSFRICIQWKKFKSINLFYYFVSSRFKILFLKNVLNFNDRLLSESIQKRFRYTVEIAYSFRL